jgi:hypothetical protein
VQRSGRGRDRGRSLSRAGGKRYAAARAEIVGHAGRGDPLHVVQQDTRTGHARGLDGGRALAFAHRHAQVRAVAPERAAVASRARRIFAESGARATSASAARAAGLAARAHGAGHRRGVSRRHALHAAERRHGVLDRVAAGCRFDGVVRRRIGRAHPHHARHGVLEFGPLRPLYPRELSGAGPAALARIGAIAYRLRTV